MFKHLYRKLFPPPTIGIVYNTCYGYIERFGVLWTSMDTSYPSYTTIRVVLDDMIPEEEPIVLLET